MIIAVDTGGTKTLVSRFDTDGNKTDIARFATPRNFEEYLAQLADTVNSVSASEVLDAVSIALPASMHDNHLYRAPNLGWENIDLMKHFEPLFPDTLVLTNNDADIAGLAEMRAFDEPPRTGLYVTLSTGIGTGLCFGGQLDAMTSLFEGGAMSLNYEGSVQRWEAFGSGKSFYERYGMYGRDVPAGDERWDDFARRAAAGLQVLIPIFEPDRVVIGGSMGTHFAKFSEPLHAALRETISAYLDRTTISQAQHPEEAVVYGCYYYAVDSLANNAA